MIKQLILVFAFASFVYGNECAGSYSVYEVIDKFEDTYKNEDNISIDHRMFWEINDPQNPEHEKEKLEKIIKDIEDCLLSEKDTTSHFLVKSYRAVFFYRIGNFEQSKKMIAQIEKWKTNLGTEVFDEEVKQVLSVHSFLNEEFISQTGNEDFGTMMVRVIPFNKKSSRKVPESTLVDKYGDPIELSIMLPGDGLQILEGLSKKRFKYLSNNKKEISFDKENDETRSFEMELNFLPLIPDDKKYTFIVKDNLGNIFRYKKRFSKTTNVKDRVLEIDFDRTWLVKEDAPQGQIKIELPRSDEYTIEVRDHMGDTVEPRTSRKDQQGNEIDIYYLKKTDPNNPHDFEIIYLEKEEKILGVNKWAYRLVLMAVTLAPILLVL